MSGLFFAIGTSHLVAAQKSANLSDRQRLQPVKQPFVNKELGMHPVFLNEEKLHRS